MPCCCLEAVKNKTLARVGAGVWLSVWLSNPDNAVKKVDFHFQRAPAEQGHRQQKDGRSPDEQIIFEKHNFAPYESLNSLHPSCCTSFVRLSAPALPFYFAASSSSPPRRRLFFHSLGFWLFVSLLLLCRKSSEGSFESSGISCKASH